MFLLPLDQPGIEVQAVYTLSGERTNIVFLNDVEVEDRWRIGEVDGGWQALMLALQDEHSAAFSPHLARFMDAVEEWAHESGRVDEPDVQAGLGRWATELEVAQLLELRVTLDGGERAGPGGGRARCPSSSAPRRSPAPPRT